MAFLKRQILLIVCLLALPIVHTVRGDGYQMERKERVGKVVDYLLSGTAQCESSKVR